MDIQNTAPMLRKQPSLLENARKHTEAFLFHNFVAIGFSYLKSRDKAFWKTQEPAIVKTYPTRPTLTVRIHLPPGFELDSTHTFPLVYLIHGGGWVLGDASQDDEQAHLLAQAGYVTVSPNYHYGPSHRFPEPLEDCTAIFKAVLADTSLRIDTWRIVVGGSSAGGNMSMAMAQNQELKGRIHAVLQLQGLADWTGELRGPWRSIPWGGVDGLKHIVPVAEFAYVPPGEDLRNPLLSPRFATRDSISSAVFFMASGAETIADEICDSARRLAGLEPCGPGTQVDPEKSFEADGGRVVYYFVPDMPHCFQYFWLEPTGDEWKARQKALTKELWEKILAWLDKVLTQEQGR